MNRPVRTRLHGGVGAVGEKPPATRLGNIAAPLPRLDSTGSRNKTLAEPTSSAQALGIELPDRIVQHRGEAHP